MTVRLKELGEPEDTPKHTSQSDERSKDKKNSRKEDLADPAVSLPDKKWVQQLEDREAPGNGISEKPWLAPHIRVKIIDKRKSHGK